MKEHDLKTAPEHFENLLNGSKTFELRFNDRDFKVGENILCREYYLGNDKYSGRSIRYKITHTLKNYAGIKRDFILLSIQRINKVERPIPSELSKSY